MGRAAQFAPGDWEELIAAFREHKLIIGEIKPSTWHRVYRHHMKHVLGAMAVLILPQNAKQLMEALVRIWADKPGGRTRQIQIQSTAALLRWGVAERRCSWGDPVLRKSSRLRWKSSTSLLWCGPSLMPAGALPFS
jgi:hypothetical protein